ncbi:Uncharacterised protein [Ewingella americana]|uniref:Uncharacterized protein n=1 Tax=Ewingella americana TaxID=41202 RepID=A0A377ND51_9GAMM|nr:Uncharacterised protein [Ewingella americana]
MKRRLHGTLGVATLKVKTVRCRHTGLKVRTVGSPPTLAQRVLNETLWNPAFFCCWKIEAAQGWNGRVSVAAVIVAKCRRLGGSRISGFEPLVSNHSFGVTSERDLLAFTPCRFRWFFGFAPSPLRGEGREEEWFKIVLSAANLTPALSLKRRGSKIKPTGKAQLKCLKTAVKNGAERMVRDQRLEA